MLSYSSNLPELNHNEIVGWENNPHILNNICILWLLDSDDNDRIKHKNKNYKRNFKTNWNITIRNSNKWKFFPRDFYIWLIMEIG